MKQIFLLMIFTLSFGGFVARAQTPCNIGADVFDNDPNGTNIRGGAGVKFKIVKTVSKGEGFWISASQGQWLKLGAASEYGFKEGWVYAPMMGVYAYRINAKNAEEKSLSLRAAPNQKGKILATVPSREPLTLQGCSGAWVKVSYDGQAGWLDANSYCSMTGGEDDQCPFEIHKD